MCMPRIDIVQYTIFVRLVMQDRTCMKYIVYVGICSYMLIYKGDARASQICLC